MKFRKPRPEPTPVDPAFAGLTELARAAHGGDAPTKPAPGKAVPELCEIAQRLAGELYVYERRGGADHLADVVEPGYGELFSRAESDTRWPRPTGRWEIVLRRGEDTETVLGEAGGEWHVGSMAVLGALVPFEGSVRIDDPGVEQGAPPPPKESPEARRAARGAGVAGGVSVVTGGPAAELYLLAAVVGSAGKVLGDRPARWHPDPVRRHDLRFWNGDAWTRFVFDARDRRQL